MKNSYDKWAFDAFGIKKFTGFAASFSASASRQEGKTVPTDNQIKASLRLFYIAFEGLSEVERNTAILRYQEGMTQIAIAETIGVSPATVWRALRSAKRHFLSAVHYDD